MGFVDIKIDLSRLRAIRFDDAARLTTLMKMTPTQSCENSFATLFMWSNAYNTKILDIGENSVLAYNSLDGIIHYPMGEPIEPARLLEIYDSFKSQGLSRTPYIYDVPVDWCEKFSDAEKYFSIVADEADADYIYDVKHLSELAGAKLRKKRNHIKHFLAAHSDYRVERLSEENLDAAWRFIRDADERRGLLTERQAMEFAVKYFCELSLNGIVLRSGDMRILGAAIFSEIRPDTYTIHFEKSDLQDDGAPQMLVKLEADALLERGISFMNREQDLGDEHLRRAKSSLDPNSMYRRLRAYPKL